jgi:hypothetical protein
MAGAQQNQQETSTFFNAARVPVIVLVGTRSGVTNELFRGLEWKKAVVLFRSKTTLLHPALRGVSSSG